MWTSCLCCYRHFSETVTCVVVFLSYVASDDACAVPFEMGAILRFLEMWMCSKFRIVFCQLWRYDSYCIQPYLAQDMFMVLAFILMCVCKILTREYNMRRHSPTQSRRPTEHMFPRKRGRNKKRRVLVLPHFRTFDSIICFRFCVCLDDVFKFIFTFFHVAMVMWILQLALILVVLFDSRKEAPWATSRSTNYAQCCLSSTLWCTSSSMFICPLFKEFEI